MANRFSLDCPIDGLALATNRAPDAVKNGSNTNVGTHTHVEFNVTLTCANGHQWAVQGELVVRRLA